jgi:flagellar motor switch protein FliN/FliY
MAADKTQAKGGTQPNAGTAAGSTNPPVHSGAQAGHPPHAFSGLKGQADGGKPTNLDFILDIPLEITVELGRTRMLIHDLLKLGQGSVIELTKPAGDTLEILANNRLIAKGDVVVMNDKYGIRLTEVISPVERLEKLK